MSNPFDDETAAFNVLQNDDGQFSLWPEGKAVPEGWRSVHGPSSRASAVHFVEHNSAQSSTGAGPR